MKHSPDEFFSVCTKAFVKVAQKFDLAATGPVCVPALQRKAEKAVGGLLRLKGFVKAFGDDPVTYYYHVFSLSFSTGVVLAMLWRNARSKFNERNVVEVIVNDPQTSPHVLAFHTLSQFGVSVEIMNELIKDLYTRFRDLFEPYAEMKDSRDHTLAGLYAAFMAGAAVLLAKTGLPPAEDG